MGAASKSQRRSGLNLGNAEKITRRAALIEQIRVLLTAKPMTLDEIAGALDLPWASVYTYVRNMEDTGAARRSGRTNGKRAELWEPGARAASTGKDTPEQQGASLGALEQALFGPARGGAA